MHPSARRDGRGLIHQVADTIRLRSAFMRGRAAQDRATRRNHRLRGRGTRHVWLRGGARRRWRPGMAALAAPAPTAATTIIQAGHP